MWLTPGLQGDPRPTSEEIGSIAYYHTAGDASDRGGLSGMHLTFELAQIQFEFIASLQHFVPNHFATTVAGDPSHDGG